MYVLLSLHDLIFQSDYNTFDVYSFQLSVHQFICSYIFLFEVTTVTLM